MSERNDRTPAALYARVSSDRQDVDLSVSAQLRALRDYADKNDYEVVREYVDEAESGRVMNRPEFQKMLDEAKRTEAPFERTRGFRAPLGLPALSWNCAGPGPRCPPGQLNHSSS